MIITSMWDNMNLLNHWKENKIMLVKIIMAISTILVSVHILNIIINLWLRRRKYAVVPHCGFDDTEKCLNWENDDEK